MSVLKQLGSVITMSIAGLPSRLWPSLATVLSIALTVLTLLVFLAMASGFSRTVAGTGSPDIAIITSGNAQAEATSRIPAEAVSLIRQAPGVAHDSDGQPIISAEALVIVEATKRGSDETSNISLRGVTPVAGQVRPGFTIVQGRMFRPGSNELIVGASALGAFDGFEIGEERRVGKLTWKVVGVFNIGESVFDSEIWGDLSTVQRLLGRNDGVQTMRAKLKTPADIETLAAFEAAEPRLEVEIKSERDYFAAQSGKLQLLIYFGWALAIFLGIGALTGALNTMYAAVEARATENATLRAIGFGRLSVFFSAMVESITLALAGALLATLAALLIFNGMTASTLGDGFTQVVFQFTVGPSELGAGLGLALALGIGGGFAPAVRAATAPVLKLGAT